MNYQERYQSWLNSEYIDPLTREELQEIQGNDLEIKERFCCDLEFGTGGLRGIIGAGTNRMNKYTIRKTTQGLANYIRGFGEEAMRRGVAIAYDSRHFSPEFAEEAALVLNANRIRTYLFPQLTPTPLLSFAVRELHTIAGIVITASHNPPQYNGYKVYWEDGGQLVPEQAGRVIREVKQVSDFTQICCMDRKRAEEEGLFHLIDGSVEDKFITTLKSYSFIDDTMRPQLGDLRIIFTPLHGTGNLPVRRLLAELGFTQVVVVPEQELPDANFPTVKYPNPEEKEAFGLAIALSKSIGADLLIGTDPDCDRIGVMEQTIDGEYTVLTGNQVGVLLSEYILSRLAGKGQLPANGIIIKTIVTTEMVREIAQKYGVSVLDTLTGFKFIGQKIKEFESTGQHTFLLGFEESNGYLIGTHARDKDAVAAAAMICEMAAFYASKGMTLSQQLTRLLEEHGYYLEDLISIHLEGLAGQEKMKAIMDNLRTNLPGVVGSRTVVTVEDYAVQKRYDLLTGAAVPLDLPQSDVLKFRFDDRSEFTIRPSGTEPKVKVYLSVAGTSLTDARELVDELKADVMRLIQG